MYILEQIKEKFNRICDLITLKSSSNKSKPITNKIIVNTNKQKQTKLNKFGYPIDIYKNESNKPK